MDDDFESGRKRHGPAIIVILALGAFLIVLGVVIVAVTEKDELVATPKAQMAPKRQLAGEATDSRNTQAAQNFESLILEHMRNELVFPEGASVVKVVAVHERIAGGRPAKIVEAIIRCRNRKGVLIQRRYGFGIVDGKILTAEPTD